MARYECEACGLAAMDLPDGFDLEFIFERGDDGAMRCQGCRAIAAADSPEAWAELEAKEIRLWSGQVTVGLWCPTCLLPSGYEVPFHRDPTGKAWLRIRRCFDDETHRLPKGES